MHKLLLLFLLQSVFFLITLHNILVEKYNTSTPLMIENPVKSPMVPPIVDNISTNFAALSFVMMSNVGVSM